MSIERVTIYQQSSGLGNPPAIGIDLAKRDFSMLIHTIFLD